MKKIWFLYLNDVVNGPYTTEELKGHIKNQKTSDNINVWWKGQTEWMPLNLWQDRLPHLLKSMNFKQEIEWHYRFHVREDEIHGPVSQSELIAFLVKQNDINEISLKSSDSDEWKVVYEIPYILEAVGISRRIHLRAPIIGNVVLKDLYPQSFKITSIGIGGLGFWSDLSLRTGQNVKLVIQSHDLSQNVHCQGEVVYQKSDGLTGVRFSHLSMEHLTVVSDHVKKFHHKIMHDKSAAA